MPIENEDVLERAPIPPLRYVDGHEVETVSYQQFDYRSEADRIGEGYEADVYAAELAPTNRTVAVKRVPKRRTTSREQVEKLMRGAELGQSICDHPYIATIYEYDHRPYPWIALEHVGGGHLDRNRDDMSLEQRLWT